LPDGSDAGTEKHIAIRHDSDDSANTVLGAPNTARYGIHAIGGGGEDEIGILPTDPGHEHEGVSQKIDVTVIEGGSVIKFRRR